MKIHHIADADATGVVIADPIPAPVSDDASAGRPSSQRALESSSLSSSCSEINDEESSTHSNSNSSSSRAARMTAQESDVDAVAMMKDPQIEALQQQGFARGLAEAVVTHSTSAFPLRIWVVDNSGSMACQDGARLVEANDNNGLIVESSTRWRELQETVEYHAQLAGLLQAPTAFRLLNHPQKANCQQFFSVAERGHELIQEDIDIALQSMESHPTASTPLTAHVHAIRKDILKLLPTLKANGTKVAIILATDGHPTDGGVAYEDFINALRSLEGLPVWIVIRLCTDEKDVVDFYNSLDAQLELNLEVLDDIEMEAKEVNKHNAFLNYALPLHRCREMGYYLRLFDLLDERKLTMYELRQFLVLLFGAEAFDGVPDPHVDWRGFADAVSKMNDNEPPQWNPITKKVQPWVDMKKLNKAYGGWRQKWKKASRWL